MKKRALSLVMACMMAGSLLAGCGSKTAEETKAANTETKAEGEVESAEAEGTEAAEGGDFKVVCLVNGSLGDKGFFDSAAEGLNKLKDEGEAEVKIVEMGRDETSYEGHFLDVSEQDWDMIVTGTFSTKELVEDIASQFPDKNYMFYDGEVNRDTVTDGNAMGIAYYSNQGAFMAGCLAAKMFQTEDANIDASSKVVGFVGSMDVVNINDFLVGYLEGIKYIDPEIKVVTSYVGSFEDVAKCTEMTTQMYNQGAQIVYAPASQSILGAATAAQNAGKYIIACDQDLYTQLKDSQPEMAKFILSSSLKNVGESLYTAIKGFKDGSMTCDKDYVLGLDSGAVGIAKNENYEACVPEDVRKELDEIEQKIIAGEIEVSSAFNMTTDEIANMRNEMKP